MEANKKVYDTIVAKFDIYLPKYQLSKLMFEFEGSQSKIVKEVSKNEKYHKYTDCDKGAFVSGKNQEEHLKSVRKSVISLNTTTYTEKEYNSLYQAAKSIGKPLGFGNIHNAINTGHLCYGLKWRYKTTKNK